MKHIQTFESFLNESEYHTEDLIKQGMLITAYHGSSKYFNSSDLLRSKTGIHLGTREQVDSRIDSLWNESPVFYEYEIKIKLTNPYPTIMTGVDNGVGHDDKDFTKYGDYNEFVYHNDVEGYPDEENNVSIFVANIKKCLVSCRLIRTINTKWITP